MNDPAITVEGVSKAYRIGLKEEMHDTLVGMAMSFVKAPLRNLKRLRRLNTFIGDAEEGADDEDILWAINNVTFEVARGEVVGIIGRNGAGKSTLLKMLSRITEPTRGRITILGRVSSLLEVGTGFHPELTGRDNIYLNGTILGMRKVEIDRKFDQIVEFSGISKFIDTPVKRYSSGMKVRLAFSVAAHLEPEILVIDEVLAVGDAEFQRRCLGKMKDFAGGGRTVLFVSHNMAAVQALCTRAILIGEGKVTADGATETVVKEYLAPSTAAVQAESLEQRTDREGDGYARFVSLEISSGDTRHSTIFMDDDIVFDIGLRANRRIRGLSIAIVIRNSHGVIVYRIVSGESHGELPEGDGAYRMACSLRKPRFLPGQYTVNLSARSVERHDLVINAGSFDVEPTSVYSTGKIPTDGVLYADCSWQVERAPHPTEPTEKAKVVA